jgi:hypothetical protein
MNEIMASLTTGLKSARAAKAQAGGGQTVMYLYQMKYDLLNPFNDKESLIGGEKSILITRVPGSDEFSPNPDVVNSKDLDMETTDEILMRRLFDNAQAGFDQTDGIFSSEAKDSSMKNWIKKVNDTAGYKLYGINDFLKENIMFHEESTGLASSNRTALGFMKSVGARNPKAFGFTKFDKCATIPANAEKLKEAGAEAPKTDTTAKASTSTAQPQQPAEQDEDRPE